MEYFELTKDHLTLLQNMNVSWDERMNGSPRIDCKRPYLTSEFKKDIAKLLGWNLFVGSDNEIVLSAEQDTLAAKLHKETETALHICLCTQSFSEGKYEKFDPYKPMAWRKVSQ